MSFKITAESDLWESRGSFTLAYKHFKQEMLRIEPRLAFINGVFLANRVLIFRFQLLAVFVLPGHKCGECRISCLV
jgi:hypothetical protein